MNWLRTLKFALSIKCQDAMALVSAEMDGDLTAAERAAIRLHLKICTSCRRARNQFHFLRHQLRQLLQTHTPGAYQTVRLSPDARKTIRQALAAARNNDHRGNDNTRRE